MRKKYVIGIDFDTLSGKVVLLDTSNGEEISSRIIEYTDKDMENKLPDGTKLGGDWTLGNPSNYLNLIKSLVPELLKDAHIYPSQVIALGIDFASYTILPIDNETSEGLGEDNLFVEATDWITMQLTGELVTSSMYYLGEKIGELNETASMNTGLLPGTILSVPSINAHVSIPALGVTEAEKMVMVMEKSIRYLVLSKEKKEVPGLCGYVEDRVIPGHYTYETIQIGAGNILSCFLERYINEEYQQAAKNEGLTNLEYLIKKSEKIRPGQSGLLALNWWDGNSSILDDGDLTSIILGINLETKAEEIFRALMEAVAFGTLKIIKNFREHGIAIKKLYVCGELADNNPLLMQILSDVCNMEIYVSALSHAMAVGSAMFASVAAGKELGGYDSIFEASKKMSRLKDIVYRPIPENVEIYNELFIEYEKLYDYFANKENSIMKKLKGIRER